MKRAILSATCTLTLLVIAGFAGISSTHAYTTQGPILAPNAVTPGVDVWYAPTVRELDWTSAKWVNSLPHYQAESHQLVLGSEDKGAAPPTDNVAATPGEAAPEPMNEHTQPGSNGATLLVYGKFTTVLSDDKIRGSNTRQTGIVWGSVEIRDCTTDDLLEATLTGNVKNAGKWSVSIANPYADGFFVRIIPYSGAASVRTGPSGGYDSYAGDTSCFYTTKSKMNIGTWYVPPDTWVSGAWMIYETIVNDARNWGAWNYFANRLGDYGVAMPGVIVRFPYEDWEHYHPGGEIHLPDMDAARSPDVIQHEYGHFVMYGSIYGTSFNTYCPSPHYAEAASHVNCAWSEGWANYIPYAIHNDKTYTRANNFEIDFEKPTWGTPGWDVGPAVEGRVAGALIDFADSQNECGGTPKTCDKASKWMLKLWYVFTFMFCVNFEEFMRTFDALYGYRTDIHTTLYHNTIDFG